MKYLIFPLLISVSFSLFAQNAEALKKLEELNITEEILTKNLKDADAEHYFKYKSTSITDTSSYYTLSEFDPSREIGERWKLLSMNGKEPSEKDMKRFSKSHNTKKKDVNGKIDRSSWNIVHEDDEFLVLGFRYDKSSLPKKYRFLGDCSGKLFYDKKTSRVTKAEYTNDIPVKISFFKVNKLDMEVFYTYSVEENSYFISKEEIIMKIRVFGQTAEAKEVNEYLEYRRI